MSQALGTNAANHSPELLISNQTLPIKYLQTAGANTNDVPTFNGTTVVWQAGGGGSGVTQLTGDVTAGPGSGSQVATIAAGAITNAKVNATAAIAFSKLAALPSADILVGSAGNVATAVAMSGDVTISNAGVTTYGGQKVFTAQRTLTNAQILALNGTALPIVTAVGAGLTSTQIIMPIAATMAYTFAVAAYATNVELDLIHAGGASALMQTSIGQAASTFTPFAPFSQQTPSAGNNFVANADLNLFVPTGNPTGGNAGASIKVTVFYTVMDVI